MMGENVAGAVDKLARDSIYLVGVRHHSPSLARVLPRLLDEARPDAVVLELPAQAQPWCEWIAHPEATAPLAFAVADDDGTIGFWPLADFSPELVALRWARTRDVPVICADLSPAARPESSEASDGEFNVGTLIDAHVRAEHPDDAWDRLVEVPSAGASPEAVRRSALAFGWAYRQGRMVDERTAAREASMREGIRRARAEHGPAVTAVTGAWHSPALTSELIDAEAESDRELLGSLNFDGEPTASLVPYSQKLLDSRSGYPSGIRDPRWQQAVLTHGDDPAAFEGAVTSLLTQLAAHLRSEGHPCGPAEIREANRMTLDLAALRGLPVPGRREFQEACTSVFAQGDVLGRGRAVARAAEKILVGNHNGALAPDTPQSGLALAFASDLAALRLPGPGERSRELTLNPLRLKDSSPEDTLDTRREIFLQRCRVARIAYGISNDVIGIGGAQAVSTRWTVLYDVSTSASLPHASRFGVTVVQTAKGVLRTRRPDSDSDPDPDVLVTGLTDAATAGLADEFDWWLNAVAAELPPRAGIDALAEAIEVIAAIGEGTVAGMLLIDRDAQIASALEILVDAAVAQVDGLAGSDDPADAAALGRLVALRHTDIGLRLAHSLTEFVSAASPLMQGAATGLLHRIGRDTDGLTSIASRIRAASSVQGRRDLTRWLTGLITASPELLTDEPSLLDDLRSGVEDIDEAMFVARLPALRGGFDPMSAAERERLLEAIGADRVRPTNVPAEELARWATEDHAAWERLQRLGLTSVAVSPKQRWSLVLGRRHHELTGTEQRRLARSLDQLYGSGDGEGSSVSYLSGRGGSEPPYPTAREWAEDLDALFGEHVREDIAASAITARNPLAIDLLDNTQPRASVELLNDILSLAGGMPESTLAKLRPILRRMVAELSQALANQLRPALNGLQGWRPTTRPSQRLDAAATIRRNLRHAVSGSDGTPQLVVATPIFRQPLARRSEWHIIVLVDVSGSMEPSTVFAAMTSAILAGVDALSVTFLAFSTEVVDLTDHVDDPLSLLLEIKVGGGTDIGGALAVAGERVTVPSRTMLVLISDFEDAYSASFMLSRIESLHNSGVRMLGCAALDDSGAARYNAKIAAHAASAGMAVSAVSPTELARWVAEQVQR